jgi:hypothetical protein
MEADERGAAVALGGAALQRCIDGIQNSNIEMIQFKIGQRHSSTAQRTDP